MRVLLLQVFATLFFVMPKMLPQETYLIPIVLIFGGLFQFFAGRQTRKAIIHESFLKNRVDSYFDNPTGGAEDEMAEFYRRELSQCLNSILEQLNLHQSPCHRIRLYLPQEEGDRRKFVIVAFHADNPDLGCGRNEEYPDDGILGKAWRQSSYFIDDLPDPNKNETEWIEEQKNRGCIINDTSLNAINFKARLYYAKVIREPSTGSKVGIIVIESTEPYSLNNKHVGRIIDRQYSWYLAKCVTKFKKYAPDPGYATQKGF